MIIANVTDMNGWDDLTGEVTATDAGGHTGIGIMNFPYLYVVPPMTKKYDFKIDAGIDKWAYAAASS